MRLLYAHSLGSYHEFMLIRLLKIGIPENPAVETGTWSGHTPGRESESSLPCGYWIEGCLLAPVTIGQPLIVHRTNRNEIRAEGIYQSSCVVHLHGERVETANSIYRLEILGHLTTQNT